MLYVSKPIVFAGGTVRDIPSDWKQRIELRPPAQRGDLDKLRLSGKRGVVVLLEGLFGASLAVTPMECRQLIDAGWQLIGASSMGALRASELWPVGMVGVGTVFSMFRVGNLRSDADVAVCYSPYDWAEITSSIVHIRAVLAEVEMSGELSGVGARKMLIAARRIHWTDRSWESVLELWGKMDISRHTLDRCDEFRLSLDIHPKMQDARSAIALVLAHRWPQARRGVAPYRVT
jgi:hypothetical protein